jgi:hypothetical protein
MVIINTHSNRNNKPSNTKVKRSGTAQRREKRDLQGEIKLWERDEQQFKNALKQVDTYLDKECTKCYDFISDRKCPM